MNDSDINHGTETTAPALVWIMVCGGGLLLLIGVGMMTALSPLFIYGKLYEQRPVITMVAVYLVAWIGYVLIFARSGAAGRSRSLFRVAMVCALAARLLMCFSSPLLENDFYRYMWDGMVVNHKVSPYAKAPQFHDVADIEPDPRQFAAAELAHSRINYPAVKTIYPPGAQAVFALNGAIFGWWPYGLRCTFLVVDLMIMILLFRSGADRAEGRRRTIIYACCPLLLKEVVNSMHLDILCAFLLTLYILSLMRHRIAPAYVWVFLAGWVKLTPFVLLVPLFFLQLRRRQWRQLAVALLLFGGASAGMLGVMTLGADEPFAGLKEFYDSWESNASIFALVRSRFEHGLLASGISADDAYAGACQNARDVLAFVYLIFLLLWWRHVRDEHAALRCSTWVLLVMFLITPVGNPWYLLWLLPFMAVLRNPMVLLLMVMTSLYYLSFHILNQELPPETKTYLRLVEYVPFYLGLCGYLLYLWRQRMRAAKSGEEAGPPATIET